MTLPSISNALVVLLAIGALACSSSSKGTTNGVGGKSAGGAMSDGGHAGSGGSNSGGTPGSGGAMSDGGHAGSGGSNSGGTPGSSGAMSDGGHAGSGGSNSGGTLGSGGISSSGGATSPGGVGGTTSPISSGGALGTGGKIGVGGSATGGSATGGSSGSCDQGSSTTTWASSCPTAAPTTCTAGTWVAGGPQSASCCSSMTLRSESDHFAVYADESSVTAASAKAAVDHLETVWSLYFGSPMYMREPFCSSATKYKANIHVHSDWGLTGGSFDGRMGMWIGSDGLADHWGLAHEFMHGVQSVEGGMACNSDNTCGWIYESHANWAAQQQTEYHTTEVHCSEYLANVPHLYLGSTRDRYCNWQFMEYLKDKYCYSAVNAIWTGKATDDPFTAIMAAQGWTMSQLNDFIGEWAMHNITWDYQDPAPESTAGDNQGKLFRAEYGLITDTSQTTRRLRLTKVEPLDADVATNRRFISPFDWAPQRFGYNVIRLYPDSGATSVTVTFRGVTSASPSPDWRWGLVATDASVTTPRYSSLQKGSDAQLTFCVSSGESLWLVVAATPSKQQTILWDQAYRTVPRYPYMVELGNAWPDGFQGGKQDACPTGLSRASNGGGCAPSSTSAYVGPYATVASGATVSSAARIEDHAYVESGSTVSGGTVGALALIGSKGGGSSFTMSSGTAKTTFYPLGFFESGQGLSGASLIGDVEYRGANFSLASGTCSGFVDSATCTAPGTDSTPALPYTWRP